MTNPVLDTAGLHLVGKNLGTPGFSFGFVNVLYQHPLVFEDISFRLLV